MSGSNLHTSDSSSATRYEAAPDNAHIDTDSKDERSIANRLSAAQKHDNGTGNDNPNTVTDPLAPARSHGNKPSRGAEIDAEIQKEEEEILKKME